MADADVDAVLLTTEADVRYFSGFLTQFWQSPTRPWFLIVPATAKPIAIIPEIGAAGMAQTWIDDIRTWPSPHASDDGVTLLGDALHEIRPTGLRLGLMMGRETHLRMPLTDFQTLQNRLSKCELHDVTGMVQVLRSVKSEAEIKKIGHAASIASTAFAGLPEWVVPGMSEVEIFRRFKMECLRLGADDVPYLVGGSGVGGYRDIISPPTERPLENGDVMILDVGCVFDGYHCDFDRNFAIGSVSETVASAYRKVWDATEAGLEAATVGRSCRDVFAAMRSLLIDVDTDASGSGVGRLGHGLGMQLTEFPSLADFDRTEIKKNMVLTLEPGYAFDDGKIDGARRKHRNSIQRSTTSDHKSPSNHCGDPMTQMAQFDYQKSQYVAPRSALGLIVLQTDEVIESEVRRQTPLDIPMFVSRVPSGLEVTHETLSQMETEIPAAARLLPEAGNIGVVAYGCTSGATIIGEDNVTDAVRSVLPDVQVTNPLTAVKARLTDLGAHRIGLLTPYIPTVSQAMIDHLQTNGFEIASAGSFFEIEEQNVTRIDAASIINAALTISNPYCDAVFASCTNLRTLELHAELEDRLGKPLVSSNSALAWHMKKLREDQLAEGD